jgi:presenilin-like A22 family membrane protease
LAIIFIRVSDLHNYYKLTGRERQKIRLDYMVRSGVDSTLSLFQLLHLLIAGLLITPDLVLLSNPVKVYNSPNMSFKKLLKNPVYWSILIFIAAQLITFVVITRENVFLDENQIYVPSQPSQDVSIWPGTTTTPSGEVIETPIYSSLGPILIYFFAVVIVLGVVLFLIPVSALKLVLRAFFAFLFAWAIFIILVLWLPLAVTLVIAAGVGLFWFFLPRVWLHNLVMVAAMVSVGAVFGRMITPWTAMILLLVLAVYDFVAVKFGYMIWMAKKLSDSNTLPAFFIPKDFGEWRHSMKESAVTNIAEEKPSDRKFSILGGGDIGFPLLLISSVYFAHGFQPAVFIAVFTLLGLISAYWIQARFLKGKPMPALPPIAVLGLIGLLILR